jgi:hypothetical protein
MGAAVAWVFVLVFTLAAGLDKDRFQLATMITVGVGFLVPLGFVWNEQRRHSKAWKEEYPRALAEYEEEKARLARVANASETPSQPLGPS